VRFERSPLDRALIERRAKEAGVQITELSRPFGAVVLALRAREPAAFLKHHFRRVFGSLAHGQGTWRYFAIEDEYGSVVYTVEATGNGGGFYSRPDLYRCGPIRRIGLIGAESEPPCAA
jgi:hypothetical protein